jgi:D-3-phosphoglycerate dehydrogenase
MPKYGHLLDPKKFDVVVHHCEQHVLEDELYDLVMGFDGVIAGGDEFTERVLAHADRLKVISKWGVGVDEVDRKAAGRLGIKVFWSPGGFADSVANTAIGYIFLLARRLHETTPQVRAGKWPKPTGLAFRTRTVGVVGVGHIGKELVRRAKAFKSRVLGNDIVEMPREFLEETGVEMVPLEQLLRESDFVVVCADLNETSYHLINAGALKRMKSEAYFINVARGKIVDEPALIAALRERRIAGAALDVFESEPPSIENPLLKMENVFLGTHNAYNEDEAIDRVTRNTFRNLIEALESSECSGKA